MYFLLFILFHLLGVCLGIFGGILIADLVKEQHDNSSGQIDKTGEHEGNTHEIGDPCNAYFKSTSGDESDG